MTNSEIISRLLASDLSDVNNVSMLFDMAKNTDNVPLALRAREYASSIARTGSNPAYELLHGIYRWLAPRDFDSYLIALEWFRKPEEQFYLPRRKQLRTIVSGLQDLADNRLDE